MTPSNFTSPESCIWTPATSKWLIVSRACRRLWMPKIIASVLSNLMRVHLRKTMHVAQVVWFHLQSPRGRLPQRVACYPHTDAEIFRVDGWLLTEAIHKPQIAAGQAPTLAGRQYDTRSRSKEIVQFIQIGIDSWGKIVFMQELDHRFQNWFVDVLLGLWCRKRHSGRVTEARSNILRRWHWNRHQE